MASIAFGTFGISQVQLEPLQLFQFQVKIHSLLEQQQNMLC
jgi:hypothetical protein